MKVNQYIGINASSERVFEYLLDISNRKDYIPALDDVIMLDPLPIKKGSRYIEVSNIAGRKLRTTYQVTNYVENKKLSAKTLKSIFPIQVDLDLTKRAQGSLLSISLNFQLSGIFKWGSKIVNRIVNQQAQTILKKVKDNLEG